MVSARVAAALIMLVIIILIAFYIRVPGQKSNPNITTSYQTNTTATTVSTMPPNSTTTSIAPNAINTTAGAFPYSFGWVIESSSLNKIISINATLAKWAFDNPNTMVLGPVPKGWASKSVAVFHNYSALNRSITSLNPNEYYGILLDQENWSFTPLSEQLNTTYYTMLSYRLAEPHGFVLISTPAIDLAKAYGYSSNFSGEFDRLGIAYNSSRYSQIYELQAQSLERNTSKFASFSHEEYLQAKSANPGIRFFIGISTNPNAENITGSELYAAISSTENFSSGYWLNVPNQSAYCPRCGEAKPEVAVQFLQILYRKAG
jgi:hypothetical protein